MTSPSSREIGQRIARAEGDDDQPPYPQRGIITILSAVMGDGEIEHIDPDDHLWRVNGEVVQVSPETETKVRRLAGR
jgi:hypothetical protein